MLSPRHPRTVLVWSKPVVWLLVGALMFSLCVRASADASDVSARLQKIRAEVSTAEKDITQLKSEFSDLSKQRKTLEASIKDLTREEQRLVEKGAQITREKEELTRKVREAEERVSAQQARIRERLRALYVGTKVSTHASLLLSSKGTDMERVAAYARAVRSYDERHFREVMSAVVQLVGARGALEQAFQEGQKLQDEVKRKRTESETQASKLKVVLDQIKVKQEAAQRSLASLRTEAASLEELLQRIMAEAPPAPEPPSVQAPEAVTPVEPRLGDAVPRPSVVRPDDVMHPEGLFGRTARISYPVKGQVVQRFGKTKVTNFSDMIFSKGFEFIAAEGASVHAVLGGRVAFAGSMPGYETVVIIDHGKRSYSLYGRLGKANVSKGDLVKRNDVVGITSQPDNKKRNFYFETRRNGSPVDPASVLAKASS